MSNIDFEDDDVSKYDVDDVDIDDNDVPKVNPKGAKVSKPGPKGKPVGPKGKITKKSSKEMDPKVMYVCIGAGVLVVGMVAFMVVSNLNAKKKAQLEAQRVAEEQALLQQQTATEDVTAGIPNLWGTGSQQNTSTVTDSGNILKDLNGNVVATNYNVAMSETVTDFISYTKHRAITGDGVEFYWLEAVYKKQPCKVQVPYSIFSKLDDEGITVVDAEVLTLDTGSQIVTYMTVRKDAKDLLDKNR